ncbi:DUF1127 domain-containing protein [Pseudorhodoferax sp.]|uniref:DUF1127 domain-containing protein n=1 Tax=Pseudorhodoferax sp. TaxID=1993553 RepID=UPI002DD6556E|nr:DUF1127 domain-containing protein [Pseudorhodoferax sp.]
MKQLTLPLGIHPAMALLIATAEAVADTLVRHAQRQAHRRLARRTEQALARLDARGLRDLGLTRSEISSVASEIASDIDATHRRMPLLHR